MSPEASNSSETSSDGKVVKAGNMMVTPTQESKSTGGSYRLAILALSIISITSLILSIALPLTVGRGSTGSSASGSQASVAGGSSSLQAAVQAGVKSFQVEAGLLSAKVNVLVSALTVGDLEAARQAYAFSRASYEQIEVLAGGFPETDCNIDCRPYAHPYGDYDPQYYGFHRIEAHLFRDSNTSAALAFAQQLQDDCANLQTELADLSRFRADITWSGMLGLAREIAYKKISGEEEAYSGMSLLIFHENYNGIMSQYLPFHELVQSADPFAAQEAAEALDEARMHVEAYYDPSGPYGVWTSYKELDDYDRKTIYDNAVRVVKGLEGAFTALGIQLETGEDKGDDGAPEIPSGFESLVEAAVSTLHGLAEEQVVSAGKLLEGIQSGDWASARALYEVSRNEYEQIEVLANSFPQIDSDIDARPYSFPLGESDPAFKGFHKIERALFRDADLDAAVEAATGLVSSAKELVTALEDLSAFNVVLAFEGMIGLALEIAAKKISGEEETFSNLSVLIFEKNWEGISKVLAPFVQSPTYANLTSIASAATALERCQNVTGAIMNDASLPPAFAGSLTPSFNHLPSDTYLQDIVMATHRLATAIVDVADDLAVFPSTHKYSKASFPRTAFQ